MSKRTRRRESIAKMHAGVTPLRPAHLDTYDDEPEFSVSVPIVHGLPEGCSCGDGDPFLRAQYYSRVNAWRNGDS